MKIAIVCGAGMVSGKEIMALELGAGLRDHGHDVVFVTSLWGDGKFRARLEAERFPKRCMRLGFISATLSLDCLRMTLDQLVRVPGLWWDYARFLRQEKRQQVIHTNWHHLLMLWPFLQKHRDWFWLHEVVPDRPQYRFVFQRLGRRLRGFIPVSDAVKVSLLRIGIPEHQIHVVHNGLADPMAGGDVSAPAWPGVRVGIVGQVGAWKGHTDLLEAFARNAAAFPNAELHVFGDNTTEFVLHLKQRAQELNLEERIVWHGFVSDRRQIYPALDVCVVPSRTPDPLPTVAIEAAFFGLPVIASCSGGLPEIVEDEATGFLFEAGNVEQLSERLSRLLGNAALRHQMGAAARELALKRFSRERFVVDFELLLTGPDCFLQPGKVNGS